MTTKISGLDAMTADTLTSGDFLVVVDTTATTTKKIDAANILDAISSSFGRTMFGKATAAAALTELGFDTFTQGLLDDGDLATWLNTMGIDGDVATLDIPASLTISANGKALLGETSSANLRNELACEHDWLNEAAIDMGTGTEKELVTGLPAELMDIEIVLWYVRCDAANETAKIILGGSSGYDTTDYISISGAQSNTSVNENYATNGFNVWSTDFAAASQGHYTYFRMTRWDASEHSWFAQWDDTAATVHMARGCGFVTLSEELTKIKCTLSGGNFEASGTCYIKYKGND